MRRTSIRLGDAETLAQKNADLRCNGNLSEYLRLLIFNDDKQIKIEQKTNEKIKILQYLSFSFLGVFFIILAVNTSIDIPTTIQITIFLFAGVLFLFLSLMTYQTNKKIKKEVKN